MNIKKIADSILKSASTDFVTSVDNVAFLNIGKMLLPAQTWRKLPEKETDIDASGKMTIQWSVDIEMREWGIKSVTTVIKNVTGSIEISDFNKKISEDIEFDAVKEGFKIENNLKFTNDTLIPKEVIIDFRRKLITIE